jgi:hypothetical protein
MAGRRRKKSGNRSGAVEFGASQAGAAATAHQAAASDATRQGMDLFRQAAQNLANVDIEKSKGNLFEYIEAARFNAAAAQKGSNLVAEVTAAHGQPTAAADIVVKSGERVVKEVQAKASAYPKWATRALAQEKYQGMDRLVPEEQAEYVRDVSRQLAERLEEKGDPRAEHFADSSEHVTGRLRAGDVESSGTKLDELYEAGKHPRLFALEEELRALGKEAVASAGSAALAGAVMGGAISTVRNLHSVTTGKKSAGEAAFDVAKDSGKSGLRAGAIGAGGAVVRHVGAKAGVGALAKSNVATAMAASAIDAGATVVAFAKGEITGEEAAERLGQNGCSTASGLYVGAAAGAVFGPPGAVVGSLVGYTMASGVYQSCMNVLREARLAELESDRVVAMCAASVAVMDAERRRFERALDEALEKREEGFTRCLDQIDGCLVSKNPEAAILPLVEIAGLCGRELKLGGFEEFDDFMERGEGGLVL